MTAASPIVSASAATEPPQQDMCDLRQAQRVAALLDRDADEVREDSPLPPGWHFALFTPTDRQSALREDGYIAANAAGLDELAGLEVMLGGRRTDYLQPIMIGSRLTRRSSTVDIARKQGRSGPLVLVTRRQEIFVEAHAEPAIVEHEDFLYRQAAVPVATGPTPAPRAPAIAPDFNGARHEIFLPTETMLFRYSALSFNAHRIHFDLPYATGKAGFRGIVVNGGLIALTLLDFFRRHVEHKPRTVSTRSGRPLFCGEPATIVLETEADGWKLAAFDAAGEQAMELRVQ